MSSCHACRPKACVQARSSRNFCRFSELALLLHRAIHDFWISRQTIAATSVLEHTAKNYMAFYDIQSLLTLTHSAGVSALPRAARFDFDHMLGSTQLVFV